MLDGAYLLLGEGPVVSQAFPFPRPQLLVGELEEDLPEPLRIPLARSFLLRFQLNPGGVEDGPQASSSVLLGGGALFLLMQ